MGMRSVRNLASLTLIALTGCNGACAGNSSRDFPLSVGFTPIEPCVASFPPATATDPHPEAVNIVQGPSSGGYNSAHGAAYVHAPLTDVYAALQFPAVSRIHGTDSTEVTMNVEPEFPISFQIVYTASGLGGAVTVHWTIVYRGGYLDQTPGAEVVGFRYQRTTGTDNVEIQDGSLVAEEVEPGAVTALQFVCHLKATGTGLPDVEGTVQDWFNDISASVHGQPIP